MRPFLLIPLLAVLPACTAPRLFQKTVPAPVVKNEAQIEHERAAADLIAKKIETPVELKPVAQSLSTSLGTPKVSLVEVKAFSLPSAAKQSTTSLDTSIVDLQRRLDATNARLTALQGKEIEGTGISVLGPGMGLLVIALITLGVIFPPAFTILFFIFRRLRAAAASVVTNIDEVAKDPEAKATVAKLKARLAAEMDRTHKQVIHTLQKP